MTPISTKAFEIGRKKRAKRKKKEVRPGKYLIEKDRIKLNGHNLIWYNANKLILRIVTNAARRGNAEELSGRNYSYFYRNA